VSQYSVGGSVTVALQFAVSQVTCRGSKCGCFSFCGNAMVCVFISCVFWVVNFICFKSVAAESGLQSIAQQCRPGSSKLRRAKPFHRPHRHFANNEKIIYLRKNFDYHITQDVRPSNCCVAAYVDLWQKRLEIRDVGHRIINALIGIQGFDVPISFRIFRGVRQTIPLNWRVAHLPHPTRLLLSWRVWLSAFGRKRFVSLKREQKSTQ